MRPAIGTVLQVAGIAVACVAAFTISYNVGAIGAGLACTYFGLAADR